MPTFSKEELDEFEATVLKAAWEFQRSNGRVSGPYPSNKKASDIHKQLFNGPPVSSLRRDMLKELDKRVTKRTQGDLHFKVTIIHGPNKYVYEIDHVPSQGRARQLAIGKYIRDNRYGHNTPALVNALINRDEISLEITPLH